MKLVYKTIEKCLAERVTETPDYIAIETEEESYTWRQLDALSDYLAIRMYTCGIKKGTLVGIWSTNTPNWVITFFALEKLGAIPVLINTGFCEKEMENILQYSGVEFVCYGDGCKKAVFENIVFRLQKLLKDKVKQWIPIGKSVNGWWKEDYFLEKEKSAESLMQLANIKNQIMANNIAVILFTSGTTSISKGVELTHYSLVNNAMEMSEHMQWNEQDKMLIAVPLFHCFGLTASLLAGVCSGYTIHLLESFRSESVMRIIHKYHCTLLNGVPSMFLAIINNPAFFQYDLRSLKKGIIAGSPVSPEEYQSIKRRIPTLNLVASYGQTETSPCVSISEINDTVREKATNVGHVLDNVEVRIADIKTSEVLKNGQTGEIQIKGYNVMAGYLNLPVETEMVFTKDEWLHSGDMGFIDEKGFLHITGRIKEMIIRGGENVEPREIEEAIKGYSGIKDVKVIGVPQEIIQEEIAACILLNDWKNFSKTGLRSFLENRLAGYKIPRYYLIFKEFPLNSSGKIKLNVLKQMAISRISREITEQENKMMA